MCLVLTFNAVGAPTRCYRPSVYLHFCITSTFTFNSSLHSCQRRLGFGVVLVCLFMSNITHKVRGRRVNRSTGHFHYFIHDSRRHQAHATPLQKTHGVNGLTGQWVDGSMGRRVNGSLSLSLYYI